VRDRNHVFSRFVRTRLAAQRAIQGIGLGPRISKAIVDSDGGRVVVESEEGGRRLDVPGPASARRARRRRLAAARKVDSDLPLVITYGKP
jgi:signal transduction histidine kinase